MRRIVWLALLAAAGCSHETLQRTGYETLRNIDQQQCLQQGNTPCPKRESYDEYQRNREALEQKNQ